MIILDEEDSYMDLLTGELAKMFNLNKQTLFYYDKEGLLIPEYRDDKTGYRKYRFEQIYKLALICYLRKIGFSIDQIREYIQDRNVTMRICELKRRSQELRKAYEYILNIDAVIQRKIVFVEHKMRNMKLGEAVEKYYLKRAYLPLGLEENIYTKEEFYFNPTIAFYRYREDTDGYETTFGAYLETMDDIDPVTADKIRYIEAQRFLCYCWKGDYKSIEQKIKELRQEYGHLGLSPNTYNFNIIDQFLEKDMEQYITEIQIPIIGTGVNEQNT